MTLRRRSHSGGGKEALFQKAAQLVKKNLGFFQQLDLGDAEMDGRPKVDLDKTRNDLIVDFPITYETRKEIDDDWTEGPDKSGTFSLYIYPSSRAELELEIGYRDSRDNEMDSDKGKEVAKGTVRSTANNLNWGMLKRELVKMKRNLGDIEAVWID